ncbi:MAG TPA: glycerol kinase GlpK, partial [Gaiellaceae bacterium]|nr:glycerol kinase GlpK [Gaiellaceae bacterium]
GTTGTTCLVVDDERRTLARGYRPLEQSFPRPGWVEHDPEQIWESVLAAAAEALAAAGLAATDLDGIGVANQRETTVLWERASGRPVAPAIVWQDRRTAARCAELPADLLRARTGLVPDPYFSATKLEWLLRDHRRPGLAFGTIDAWLAWKLCGEHVTDRTNASRTLLYDLDAEGWSDELCALFGVEPELLPRVAESAEVVGEAELLGARLPLAALAGDQQAALVGQGCLAAGAGKATYGTGSFVLVHAGERRPDAPAGLLVTAAAAPARSYAYEGSILVSGAAIQWLRDGLGLIASAAESEELARSVDSTGGVVFVPALTGLGSPHWEPEARGLVSGLTRGTTRAHLVRAALEAIAFEVADVVESLPVPLGVLRADGGATQNAWLMQFQADVLGCPVEVAAERDATALGAATLAGAALGKWRSDEPSPAVGARYEPGREVDREPWRQAVARTLGPARTS